MSKLNKMWFFFLHIDKKENPDKKDSLARQQPSQKESIDKNKALQKLKPQWKENIYEKKSLNK